MYTRTFARTRRLVFFLCALCVLRGESPAQDFKTVHDGVEHARVEHKLGSDPVKINLLRLDLRKVRLDVHHAFDKAIGLELTSSIAKRKGSVAAINAGFFRLDKSEWAGDAAGLLIVDGRILSESVNDRATFVISNLSRETYIFFENYKSETWVLLGENIPPIALSGINRERKKGEAIIYDNEFAPKLKRQPGEVALNLGKCGRLGSAGHSDRSIVCREIEVHGDGRNSAKEQNFDFAILMEKGLVSDAAISNLENQRNKKIVIGTMITHGGSAFFYTNRIDATNGIPQLVKNGKIDITWEQEKASRSFVETRHPRTAVAKLKDGKFLMITVDGRQPGVSVGMNLQELAEYLLTLGAVDAMNLDGGGSTTMYLDGRVVNTPSDREGERKVGDAILVTLRKNAGTKK